MLPDVVINVVDGASGRTYPSDTGTCFMVGEAERGLDTFPQEILSLSQFQSVYGARQTPYLLYDAADTFFNEGGGRLMVQRVTGSGAAQATLNLMDAAGTPAISLAATALGKGTWGNSLKLAVSGGGASTVIIITRTINAIDVEVERSYVLADQDTAVAWSQGSQYIRLAKGVSTSNPAVVSATSMSSGTNGSAVGDSDYSAALAKISPDYGPGQIAAPGSVTSTRHVYLLQHAQQNIRFALLDAPDAASAGTLTAVATSDYSATNSGRRWGQMAAPWEIIPGVTPTTTRTVPPCARLAAQYAKVDALGNPNVAAAGNKNNRGVAQYVYDLSQSAWSDTDRQTLNEAGITVSRIRFGDVVTFGMRTLADQNLDANWSMSPNVRVIMWYITQARFVAESAQFDQVDGGGIALSDLRGSLNGIANDLFSIGALYGETPADAYYVDTGVGINPVQQIAQGIIHASVKLRTSPTSERVVVNIVKVPITSPVA